jgi:DNA-binding response OmpR family regulator
MQNLRMETANKTTIVIEDDNDICTLLSIIIKSHNMGVFVVHTLEKARNLNAIPNVALVFIDQRLPDGNGFDFIPYLKKQYPMALIVAMSAQNPKETKVLVLQYGNICYLEKPFKINELKKLIEKVL